MKTVEELRAELLSIGLLIGKGRRPNVYFTIPTKSDGLGTPHLEIHDDEFHFVVSERGLEISRQVTKDSDELLYWFTDSCVSGLASRYAEKLCLPDDEFRRSFFRKQYQLMLSVKPDWATRKRMEITSTLQRSPFAHFEQ